MKGIKDRNSHCEVEAAALFPSAINTLACEIMSLFKVWNQGRGARDAIPKVTRKRLTIC
jgi:hypothetical protein